MAKLGWQEILRNVQEISEQIKIPRRFPWETSSKYEGKRDR